MSHEMRVEKEKCRDDDIGSLPDSMIDFPQQNIKNGNMEQFILL
jgi:hypothetical protein